MHQLTRDAIRTLVHHREPPCISIYQPTHRRFPDNRQDPIRFKNLLNSVEESLAKAYPKRDVRAIVEPLRELTGDSLFWNHTLDGLAVLAAGGEFHVHSLQRPVKELAIVADSFHLRPLLRIVQSADRYHVLCLTRHTAKMFVGNRDALDPLNMGDCPQTIEQALGEEKTEPRYNVSLQGQGVGGSPIVHGHGTVTDEIAKDTERFFRSIDREVANRFSKPSGLPLLLVALSEHQPVFRRVSQNVALMERGIEINPESLSVEDLRVAAWREVEPLYLERLAGLSEDFRTAAAHQKGSADLSDTARSAVAGRVAVLLVEADRVIPGRLDPTSGAIEGGDLGHPQIDDLLDDVAEMVLRTGGEVVVVPPDRMPSNSGLAATYRY